MTIRERRFHQRHVTLLLEQIASRVAELERWRVGGVRGRALARIESEIDELREQLAATVRGRLLSH